MRDFGFRRSVFHVIAQVHQRQDLPFAHQLLGQVAFKQLNFPRQRARQLGLLHQLRIHQLSFAQRQHLHVIQPDRRRADQQQRSQHKPQNAHAAGADAGPQRCEVGRHLPETSLGETFRGSHKPEVQGTRSYNWTIGTRRCK